LTSDYDGLRKYFNDLQTSHIAVVKEKADLEKMEREKAQWFCNQLHKKLAELPRYMEESIAALGGRCMDFLTTNATVSDMLEWFRMVVQSLPIAFAECNKNITCFAQNGVFKMLAGVECGHLPELKKSALTCDASLLHDVPDDLGKIAWRVVKHWWTKYGLSYCMQRIEVENRVSFTPAHFSRRRRIMLF
jgi:hypothetical protein